MLIVLNVIAYVTMFLDHFSYLINDFPILRVIGRFSMPIFVFLLAYGSLHTKNVEKYMLRIFFIWAASQIPYTLLFQKRELNILFSFVLCLLLTHWKSPYKKYLWLLFIMCEYTYYVPTLFFAFRRLSRILYKIPLTARSSERFTRFKRLKYVLYPGHIILFCIIKWVILC